MPQPDPRVRLPDAALALTRLSLVVLVLTILGLLALAAPAARAGEEPELRLRITPEYASGHYGNPVRTEVWTVPVDVTLYIGRWTATLRVPTLTVTGPGGFVPRIGAVGGSQATGRTTNSGLGDTRLTLAYTVLQGGDDPFEPYLDIAVQQRMPTASDPALGSGLWEQAVRIDTGFAINDALSFDASLGHRFVLFPPKGGAGYDYTYLYAAVTWDIDAKTAIGLGIDTQNRVPDARRPVLEIGAFADRKLGNGLTFGVFLWHGVTRESADWSGGFRLVWRGTPPFG